MNTIQKHLTACELSKILGITERTVKKLAQTKQLPCTYKNRRLIFDLPQILTYFGRLEGSIL